jgi:hypothetical protein
MNPVLSKIIHTDQKGFVAGRNISENNRMLDDKQKNHTIVEIIRSNMTIVYRGITFLARHSQFNEKMAGLN